jgi:hypothetical protein
VTRTRLAEGLKSLKNSEKESVDALLKEAIEAAFPGAK